MSVVIETTIGDITVDLYLEKRPRTCLNFLKLCKLKYYNFNLFHTIQQDFIAQTGDPTGSGQSGSSVWGILEGAGKRFFQAETTPKIRHSDVGLISMVSSGDGMIGSQFFFTLGADLLSLDDSHCVFGEVVEGEDILRKLNETICDETSRPYKDVRITHTVILDDPFENPRGYREPSRSPSPSAERLRGGRIAADEDINDTEGKTDEQVNEMLREQEAKAQATILEIVGDLPDADMAPPENVLFVCKLNPVTNDDDLEIIFSRFGKVKACEVIRDKTSGDSLQYAFVEFEEQKSCEDAYLKMDNVLIDDRRIHVDFSQSVAKLQWKGKGRGVVDMDDRSNGGRGGGGGKQSGRNPKINFNDRNWKNGRGGGGGEFRGRNRSRSSLERRGVEPRTNSPQRRKESPKRRSRSRSPKRQERRRDDRDDDRGRGRIDRDNGDRGRQHDREERGKRSDEYQRNNRPRDNRSRSPPSRSRDYHQSNRNQDDRRQMSRNYNRDEQQRPSNRRRSSRSASREYAVQSRRDGNKPRSRRESPLRSDPRRSGQRDRSEESQSRSKVASRKRSESKTSGRRSDSEEEEEQSKKKSSKQKRNKTKKSKVSRTSSDDSSSSSSSSSSSESDSDNQDKRRRKGKKKSKKSKRKHKKNKYRECHL